MPFGSDNLLILAGESPQMKPSHYRVNLKETLRKDQDSTKTAGSRAKCLCKNLFVLRYLKRWANFRCWATSRSAAT
jgi:hypothetical protein